MNIETLKKASALADRMAALKLKIAALEDHRSIISVTVHPYKEGKLVEHFTLNVPQAAHQIVLAALRSEMYSITSELTALDIELDSQEDK